MTVDRDSIEKAVKKCCPYLTNTERGKLSRRIHIELTHEDGQKDDAQIMEAIGDVRRACHEQSPRRVHNDLLDVVPMPYIGAKALQNAAAYIYREGVRDGIEGRAS